MELGLGPNTLFVVTGSCLRAERMDRPLAARVSADAAQLLRPRLDEAPDVAVLSDVWYLNSRELHHVPTISVGGPGVNHLAAYWQRQLPVALLVENVLQIQMDVQGRDHRCSVWGTNHETTVEAVDTFLAKGHLERFLRCFPRSLG